MSLPDVMDNCGPAKAAEEWRAVHGWRGFYEVSESGRVRSIDRVVELRNGWTRRYPGVERVTTWHGPARSAKLAVQLFSPLKPMRWHLVHVLVGEAFICPRPSGLVLRHLDDDASNNHWTNLAWGTLAENSQDMVRNGHHWKQPTTHCPRNHPLTAPNLVHYRAPQERVCLACSRGAANVRDAARRGEALDLQTEADRHYAALLANPGPLVSSSKGEDNKAAVLTEERVKELRAARDRGARVVDLVQEFGVCKQQVRNIINRTSWDHI